MSPNLKPLILPALVHERRKWQVQKPHPDCDLPYVYTTANSSCSDLATPISPTFSPKGHFRMSSSSSSIDIPPQLPDNPTSPTQMSKASKSLLPDVQEEPLEPLYDDESVLSDDDFGLYSCLCDEPCEHRDSSDGMGFRGNFIGEFDLDYEMGFLSDCDASDPRYLKKKSGTESPFSGLGSRIGSRLPSVTRWRQGSRSRSNTVLSPANELSLESVVFSSVGPSSRSSSMSAPGRPVPDRLHDASVIPTPALSFYESSESINLPPIDTSYAHLERERERGLATTPLLPPLMTSPLSPPPPEAPLQAPSVAASSMTESQSPTHLARPSLSAKPSFASFRMGPINTDLPLLLPSIMQESDEWSDRLGHANFTITPQPYRAEVVNLEALRQLRSDWDQARCNYTKHLVRTGENYGETSKIYALTEAKWAETERRWRSFHDELMDQIVATSGADPTSTHSRSRSRGRARVRADSGSAVLTGRPPMDDVFAGMQWRRLEDGMPSNIPRLLDADGKFPSRGDEDIVGPMQRDEVMLRTHSEERRGARFWKNLAGRVGLRK